MLRSKYGGSKLSDACPTHNTEELSNLASFDVNQQTLAESNRRLVGSNVRSNQVSAETGLGGSEGAWAGAYGGEGQCYTRRCPCNPAPNTFQTSGINSFASPFLSSSQICTKLSRSIKSSSGKPSGRRAVRGPEWGSDADPQCSRRWLNAISPPASHGSALMCWNASGVPAQMPVKSMWKLRSELRKRWNVDWAAEEWKGGRTEDFGEGVAACRHSPSLSHSVQIPHTAERAKNTGVKLTLVTCAVAFVLVLGHHHQAGVGRRGVGQRHPDRAVVGRAVRAECAR